MTGDRIIEPLAEPRDVNVLVLAKGAERYVWVYRDEQAAAALRSLGRFAAYPDLSFTWYDAAVMSQRIRKNVSS